MRAANCQGGRGIGSVGDDVGEGTACASVYVCMYACMHVCMYARMYVRLYVCMYVRMYLRIYVRMQASECPLARRATACMMYDAHHSPASARSEATSENAVRKALFEAVRCHLTASAAPSAAPPRCLGWMWLGTR